MRRIFQNLKIFVIIFLNIVDIIMIPILTKTLINNFYKNWIEKSVIGNFDHGVYVYKKFKKIMGF